MDQKLENILNLALETPEEEREQTESLNVGYSAETRSWELIVKYHGSLDRLREQNIVVEELIGAFFWLYWILGSPGIWRCSGRQMAVRGYGIYGIRQCRRKQTM